MRGLKERAEAGQRISDLECLTGKDIQINIVRLFNEVGRDIRCLNQLNEGVPLFISASKTDHTRGTIRDHINALYQRFGECSNI